MLAVHLSGVCMRLVLQVHTRKQFEPVLVPAVILQGHLEDEAESLWCYSLPGASSGCGCACMHAFVRVCMCACSHVGIAAMRTHRVAGARLYRRVIRPIYCCRGCRAWDFKSILLGLSCFGLMTSVCFTPFCNRNACPILVPSLNKGRRELSFDFVGNHSWERMS